MIHRMKNGRAACGAAVTSGVSSDVSRITCPACRSMKWLIVQTNSDGRPCGWATSLDRSGAEREAARQYETHGHPPGSGCYPGEQKGKVTVKLIPTA